MKPVTGSPLLGRALLVIASVAVLAGCGGPKTAAPPTNAEAIATFGRELDARLEAVTAAPGTAVRELDLAIESLTGHVASHGEPFSSWLAVAQDVRTAWGRNPSKAAIEEGLDRLRAVVRAGH